MKSRKVIITIALSMASICVTFLPAAGADVWDQATRLTLNQPIEIPGHKILAAGTYLFEMDREMGSARVVRIFNADRTKLYDTLPVEAAYRPNRTPDTEVILGEPSQNQPKQLLSWFYPDRQDGQQFVYSRQEEKEIGHEAKVTVMASPEGRAYGD